MKKYSFFLFLALVLIPVFCWACSFDTDCEVGSKCIKQSGSLDGYCAGGMNPGNQNDSKPIRKDYNYNDKTGNTCNSNFDCNLNQKCMKGSGQIYGVCL